jgi:Uma2 family endonuclease
MSDATRLVTAEELERYPDDHYRYELVEGRVIRMSPVGYQHGRIVMQFGFLLGQHVRGPALGVVVTEVGFTLATTPDTVRAPDIAFIRQKRIPATGPKGFWKGPPDLAVEVLSPDDHPADVRAKVEEYLGHGTPLVVVIDPDETTVTAHRPSAPPATLRAVDILDLSDVVPGFSCEVAEIFE